ncbi:MAG: hypothetical protein OEV89_05110 [Desulfobulbaceae bacterium]|nr:hypothetical protein [Desulfobulbaceae bacterium]HIJ90128.1 hypothetical protein [Deltaproteobacteria bacterium]
MFRQLQFLCAIAFFACFLVPAQALAANDGVWIGSSGQETGYFMITQVSNGNYGLIEFGLNPGSPYYMAYYGTSSRLDLLLDSIPDACPDYYVLQFSSENTGTMTLYPREDVASSCTSSHYGIPFQITRF